MVFAADLRAEAAMRLPLAPLSQNKNAGRGVGTAGIARKWEGERRVRFPAAHLSVLDRTR
jgi:hypothetical protein